MVSPEQSKPDGEAPAHTYGMPWYDRIVSAGEIEPPIAAADLAITTGKLEPVADMITQRTNAGLHQQFERVMATRSYDAKNVDAARAHVGATLLEFGSPWCGYCRRLKDH